MSLVVVVLILLFWGGYSIIDFFTPASPPIKDINEHYRIISSLKTPAERRKYLRKHWNDL